MDGAPTKVGLEQFPFDAHRVSLCAGSPPRLPEGKLPPTVPPVQIFEHSKPLTKTLADEARAFVAARAAAQRNVFHPRCQAVELLADLTAPEVKAEVKLFVVTFLLLILKLQILTGCAVSALACFGTAVGRPLPSPTVAGAQGSATSETSVGKRQNR